MSERAQIFYLLFCAALLFAVKWAVDHEGVRRWVCRRLGHVPIADERGRPVTAFNVCLRCGKILERIP